METNLHETMMRQALELAAVADREGDMGVGAVIVREGEIVVPADATASTPATR